ncbi:2-dehydro-3-deoxygluconokinase [Brevibacterium sanguinis]|uniref:2-dehydro-3-deoxygluconokinase n=2 Tax=Brevibacterium TaxID=1696 RepID=A0A366IKH0_9MICO|nr:MULTISPECIES: sugar kinase [Brevibacterium]RBP66067.1 2-dehydro-3-deoxygluconokinase [Brevibacterium sanguinis]RBP72718.1 2-dehydro-3-deoxygluconokinase [Brevibacterium celere]
MLTSDGSVLTLGETMGLITGSHVGSFAHVAHAQVGIGGAESNVAVGLVRLGVPVSWVGRVGDDSLGNRVVREIRGEGVDVRATLDPDAPTGLMLKEFRGRGTSRVSYYRANSAGSRLNPTDVGPGVVESASLVHLTGITPLLSDSARAACLDVTRRARVAGVRISLDINYRPSLASADEAAEVIGELASSADLVFGSPEEIALVSPRTPGTANETLESLLARARNLEDDDEGIDGLVRTFDPDGRREVVVKRGPFGATSCFDGSSFIAAGHPVDVVDTVGAGDAFVAGYLSGDVQDWPIDQKLTRANACGALMCTIPGDWEASPTPEELDGFIAGGTDPVLR